MSHRRGLFGFTEVMRGTWTPADGRGRQVMHFHVEADALSARAWLRRGVLRMVGTLTAEGLASAAPARGEMEIQLSRRRIGYDLDFVGDDGNAYRFAGEKQLSLSSLLRSFTTLPGEITALGKPHRAGEVVGTALLRFDLKGDLQPFLLSWRRARLGPSDDAQVLELLEERRSLPAGADPNRLGAVAAG